MGEANMRFPDAAETDELKNEDEVGTAFLERMGWGNEGCARSGTRRCPRDSMSL